MQSRFDTERKALGEHIQIYDLTGGRYNWVGLQLGKCLREYAKHPTLPGFILSCAKSRVPGMVGLPVAQKPNQLEGPRCKEKPSQAGKRCVNVRL